MTSPHYTHDFLINIGGINIGIFLGNNIQSDYGWRDLLLTSLRSVLVDKTTCPTPSYKIIFTGPRLSRGGLDRRTIRKHVILPQVKGRSLFFNVLLHPNLLLLNIYPLIARELAKRNILTIHASGIIVNSQAILFGGVSGSGKSTILSQRPKESLVLGDDKILLRTQKGNLSALPSPLNNKTIVDNLPNSGASVSKIIFIKKQEPVRLEKIPPKAALPLIINQFQTPPLNNSIRKSLLRSAKLLSHRAFYLSYTLGKNIEEILIELSNEIRQKQPHLRANRQRTSRPGAQEGQVDSIKQHRGLYLGSFEKALNHPRNNNSHKKDLLRCI